jgi:hypothetical protein
MYFGDHTSFSFHRFVSNFCMSSIVSVLPTIKIFLILSLKNIKEDKVIEIVMINISQNNASILETINLLEKIILSALLKFILIEKLSN